MWVKRAAVLLGVSIGAAPLGALAHVDPPDMPSGPNLEYYGGPVISHPKVVAVFWGDQVDPETQDRIGGFYQATTSQDFLGWLSQYATQGPAVTGDKGTAQTIGGGSYAGAYTIQPDQTSGTIDDRAIQAELARQIASGALPKPDANTIYQLYFPRGMVITNGKMTSDPPKGDTTKGFAAYHGAFQEGSQVVHYGVFPDLHGHPGWGSDGGSAFDHLTVASSHELVETITDPHGPLARQWGPPIGWYDRYTQIAPELPPGAEIGDLCMDVKGNPPKAFPRSTTFAGYAVQKVWNNQTQSCYAPTDPGMQGIADFFRYDLPGILAYDFFGFNGALSAPTQGSGAGGGSGPSGGGQTR